MIGSKSLHIPFQSHHGEVGYECKLRALFRDGPNNGKEMVDLSKGSLSAPYSDFYIVDETE